MDNDKLKMCCLFCNNKYSSNDSVRNHMRIYHEKEYYEKNAEKKKNILNCKYCDKECRNKQSKYSHQLHCKEKDNPKIINNTNNTTHNNSHNTINSHNTTNNTTINNNYHNFGSPEEMEAITAILEKNINFFMKQYMHNIIPKMIETIYLNDEHKMLQNARITNLENKYGYVFKNGNFECIEKKNMLNLMLKTHFDVFTNMCDVLESENKLSKSADLKYKRLEEHYSLEKGEKIEYEVDDVVYKSVKEYNSDEVLKLLYNKSKK